MNADVDVSIHIISSTQVIQYRILNTYLTFIISRELLNNMISLSPSFDIQFDCCLLLFSFKVFVLLLDCYVYVIAIDIFVFNFVIVELQKLWLHRRIPESRLLNILPVLWFCLILNSYLTLLSIWCVYYWLVHLFDKSTYCLCNRYPILQLLYIDLLTTTKMVSLQCNIYVL